MNRKDVEVGMSKRQNWIEGLLGRIREKRLLRRGIALCMLTLLLEQPGMGLVQTLRAETSGATAPEVTKFEPVDTTDLVNLASGDFTYNIPIINVPGPEGGYPLALNYHSGIRHGEEASWVGLGWNLQPGSIARGVRGYPDDFRGEPISKNFLSNDYETYGIGVGFSIGIVNVTVGVNYTTYKGFGGSVGLGVGLEGTGLSAGVTLSVSPGGAIGVGVDVGFTMACGANMGISMSDTGKVSGSVGYRTPQGKDSATGNPVSTDRVGVSLHTDGKSVGVSAGVDLNSKGVSGTGISHSAATSASFSSYSGGGEHVQSWTIPLVFVSISYSRFWIDKLEEERAYGYFYHHVPDAHGDRVNEWNMESDPNLDSGDTTQHALTFGLNYLPSYDGYSVMGQGTGGNIRPTRLADRVYRPRRAADKWYEGMDWPWPAGDTTNKARFVFDGDNSEEIPFGDFIGDANNLRSPNGHMEGESPLRTQLDGPLGKSAPVSQSDFSSSDQTNSVFLGKRFRPGGGSKVVKPSINPANGKFIAFDVWETDGKHYTFGAPVYNWWSENLSANVPEIKNEYFRSKVRINSPYAYAWYLTKLRYPDYLCMDPNGAMTEKDHGGWVRFDYMTGVSDYRWHTSSDGQFNDGPVNREDKVGSQKAGMRYSMEFGAKELKYLSQIETATHRAFFATSPRLDAQEVNLNWRLPSVGTVTLFADDTNASLFTVSTSHIEALGINISRPPDSTPGASAIYNGNSWKLISHSETGEVDDELKSTTIVDIYEIPLDQSIGFAVNGLPFSSLPNSALKCTKRYNRTISYDVGGKPRASTSTTYTYNLRFDITRQFWNQPIPGVPDAFPELLPKWADFLSKKTIQLTRMGMVRLDNIYLIEKATNRLIKQVNFRYNYDLVGGTPNSLRHDQFNLRKGKLALQSVQVFGQGGMASGDNGLPPYRFFYDFNPDYGDKYKYDRWGFHKSNGGRWNHRDSIPEDQAAWNLTRIQLPTGGWNLIQYEPKDYARVQDRFPLNPRANARLVSNYLVDLSGWLGKLGIAKWPSSKEEWTRFHQALNNKDMAPWMETFPPGGNSSTGVPSVTSALDPAQNPTIPIQAAPNPIDLKLWLSKSSPEYLQKQSLAKSLFQGGTQAALMIQSSGEERVFDTESPKSPYLASAPSAESAGYGAPVERMVNFTFEFWTAGDRPFKKMRRPYKDLDNSDVVTLDETDRTENLMLSAVAMMRNDNSSKRAQIIVTDPDFEWPREAPSAIYVTWTQPVPKIGGGARVKRVIATDGRRSFATTYTYADFVNSEWTTSGVAANEPPPFGYSSEDDRVIQTEKGGWANEVGGGIYHSRVIVRHGWSDDPLPAGAVRADGTLVTTPMGESAFRFITPADLPHRQKYVDRVMTYTDPATSVTKVNSARLTEIFNMGAWWGKPLWKEDRDKEGVPINRVEYKYTQLDGYLRYYKSTGIGRVGQDKDWESLNGKRANLSYDWVADRAPSSTSSQVYLPKVVKGDPEGGPDPSVLPRVGLNFPESCVEPAYLNSSVGVTLLNAANATHSSMNIVRELNIYPLVAETRTYGERLSAAVSGKTIPSKIEKNVLWDGRTGIAIETWVSGRGNDWIATRKWPAYWLYPGMDKLRDDSGATQKDGDGDPIPVNMLSHVAHTTSSRLTQEGGETYLNSKAQTWFRQQADSKPGWWTPGGEFVWNGKVGEQAPVTTFTGYPDKVSKTGWLPDSSALESIGFQPFKGANWLFAGATTRYDAFGHGLEFVDGDGVYGCSRFGYPYGEDGKIGLPAGTLPVAKFANARYDETAYENFEDQPWSTSSGISDDPLVRLETAYTGELARTLDYSFTLPSGGGEYELRYFVQAVSANQAKGTYKGPGSITSVTQAERSRSGRVWWFVRCKVPSGSLVSISASKSNPIDDVAAFPWRRNGAPASISHYAYDRILGLVTSITGSNGRTIRYRYDLQGRLKTVYDAYGRPAAATRYLHAAPSSAQ